MKIPKDKSKRKRNEILKTKKCSFPGCEVTFEGTGKSKYCLEHCLKKYRKIIDEDKNNKEKLKLLSSNQLIEHDYITPVVLDLKCALEDCNNHFEIILLPRVNVYPQYCEAHRNVYKRTFFVQNRNKVRTEMQTEVLPKQ
jgi:hypothetical protein